MLDAKALSGLRVLDLSRVRAGPACVRILADFGADVIRVEPPPGVDPNEAMFAADRMSGDFQNLNRNKRSMTLNLKYPEGREILYKMVEKADIVVENWRPDVKARLGLDYETLRKINPRIILASISGYGQSGPYERRPGFDQIIQGVSGLMSVTGEAGGKPMRAGLAVADVGAGMYAAVGILLAVIERERSGEGQWVQSSLLHSLIAMLDFQAARYLNDGDVPVAVGNDHPTSSPMGVYEASDGPFNLGSSGEGTWQRLCAIIEREDLVANPDFANERLRVQNRPKLNEILAPIFAQHTVNHWVEALNDGGVPCGPVYTIPQVFEDPQVAHLEVVATAPTSVDQDMKVITQPVRLSRTPAEVNHGAPQWGEHTESVLLEAGFDAAQIKAFADKGVV